MLDNGYPQSTDPEALKILTDEASKKGASIEDMQQIASQVTGQIGWRREGIKYKKNEIYLDVVEKVNCLVSPTGSVLSQNVDGVIQMKCYLTGMPDCKFGINDKLVAATRPAEPEAGGGAKKKKKKKSAAAIELDDLTFHQCVRLQKFDEKRSISFCPPDGEFDLMKYRTTEGVQLPFTIMPNVQEFGDSIDITVVIKGDFPKILMATKVEITIPVPSSASKCDVRCKSGRAKYKVPPPPPSAACAPAPLTTRSPGPTPSRGRCGPSRGASPRRAPPRSSCWRPSVAPTAASPRACQPPGLAGHKEEGALIAAAADCALVRDPLCVLRAPGQVPAGDGAQAGVRRQFGAKVGALLGVERLLQHKVLSCRRPGHLKPQLHTMSLRDPSRRTPGTFKARREGVRKMAAILDPMRRIELRGALASRSAELGAGLAKPPRAGVAGGW